MRTLKVEAVTHAQMALTRASLEADVCPRFLLDLTDADTPGPDNKAMKLNRTWHALLQQRSVSDASL